MAFFRTIFVVCFCALFCVQAFAGVGDYDKRQKADWTSDEFSKYVSIGGKDFSRCTGQYIAPNLILTAAHCYPGYKVGETDDVYNPVINKDDSFEVQLVKLGNYRSVNRASRKQDYAILLVTDKNNYYTQGGFNIGALDEAQEYEPIINAGFGWVRILSNDEVVFLRNTLNNKLKKVKSMSFSSAEEIIDEALKEKNMKPLRDDNLNLKYSNCNILIGADCYYICQEYLNYTDGGKRKNSQYNPEKCKTVCENKSNIIKDNEWYPDVLGTTCDSWGGNSGGASFSAKTGNLVSICSAGTNTVGNTEDVNFAVSSFALRDVVEQMKKEYPVQSTAPKKQEHVKEMPIEKVSKSTEPANTKKEDVPAVSNDIEPKAQEKTADVVVADDKEKTNKKQEHIDKIPGMSIGDIFKSTETDNIKLTGLQGVSGLFIPDDHETETPETTADVTVNIDPTTKINNIKENVEKVLNNGDISVRDILFIVDGMTQIEVLEQQYAKAKERENSLENRMLGATTMAATGIGGMQLAQGLAEQNADKKAEADMAAYMATFQCRIGDKGGKSYPGGTSNIETPGANQLINTYQEYVALAKDLSERKSALGMKPGIEVEVILDKSATGLYDDVGHGVMGGTYASLYRAAMGNETDKQKLDSDKEASSNRVKGGAIAAGGGAVGGAIGNMLINGGDDADAKSEKNTSAKSSVDWKQVGAAIGNKVDLNKISTAIK